MAGVTELPRRIHEVKAHLDGRTTIILFWAPAIAGCQDAMMQLRELATKYDSVEFGHVNIFDNADTPSHLNLLVFPSFLVFERGQVVCKISGLMTDDELHEKLQPWLN